MNDIRRFYHNNHNQILLVVTSALFLLSVGCSALTEFDRDKINSQDNNGATAAEGGTLTQPSEDGGRTNDGGPIVNGRRDGTSPAVVDPNSECHTASDCPTFRDPCRETICDDGYCEVTARILDVECDAECGTIVDECGNPVECGRCEAGFICINNSCVSGCGGCDIDGTCHEVGAVNPANQCEICSPVNSTTSWSPNSGALCDDGKFCTVSDSCDGNVCSGTNRSCDDGISCNGEETCSESDGSCLPGTSTCDALQYCDSNTDSCISICAETDCIINRTCYQNGFHNRANPCLVCYVAENTDDWTVAVGATCGDNETECSEIDTCDASGNCLPNNAPQGTPCGSPATECSAQDTCDGRGNCLANHFSARTGCGTPAECENQDLCDGNGVCVDQGFKWLFSACGDGPTNCSNQDRCDGFGNCLLYHFADGTWCDNGDDACSWRECRSGICNTQIKRGPSCDDSNPCTSDGCRDYNGNCQPGAPVANGTWCAAGSSPCSWRECSAGVCSSNLVQGDSCDDQNPCTSNGCLDRNDNCRPGTPVANGTWCAAGSSPCSWRECNAGVCSSSLTQGDSCDDGNPCTADGCLDHDDDCHPGAPVANGTWCAAGSSPCSWRECNAGYCSSTLTQGDSCDDQNPCTADGCLDHNDNCQPGAPVADGTWCAAGGSSCSWRECSAGVCSSNPVQGDSCDDQGQCIVDGCQDRYGLCHPVSPVCDDGIACTADSCDAGQCINNSSGCPDAGQ